MLAPIENQEATATFWLYKRLATTAVRLDLQPLSAGSPRAVCAGFTTRV